MQDTTKCCTNLVWLWNYFDTKKIAHLMTNVSLCMKNQQTVGLGKIVGDLCLYEHGGLNAVENENDAVGFFPEGDLIFFICISIRKVVISRNKMKL